MKISYKWLQDYITEKLPEPELLAEKIIFGAFEVEGVEKIGDDTVFDIKVLPDRAHDCLSHYGIAREVSGLLGLTLKPIEYRRHYSIESDISVTIETDFCRRYIARKVVSVTVGPSPKWLSDRLESIGQRSINNIVDATNYVMFAYGQPMHAFDDDKMTTGKLMVRPGVSGESITTLDGKIIALDESVVVVADERHPLAIAGVKGGTVAEVDSSTKNIVIEVANFDPVGVRKTARKLGILTDSAKRFENELTQHLAGTMIHVITDLIVDIAGGQPEDPIDSYKNLAVQKTVAFTTRYINQVLGTEMTATEMADILNRYGYEFAQETDAFSVVVPYERIDITGPHDMVEEIGRAYGYEKIIPKIPEIDFKPQINESFAQICAVKNHLIEQGYSEVQTYAFTKKGDFEVAYGTAGKSALRTNLKDELQKSFELNKLNAPLLPSDEVKLFEVGTVFPKSGEEIHVAWVDKKSVQEMTLVEYVTKNNLSYSHYVFPVSNSEPVSFKMWSEYPFITRDIALWIPSEVSPDEVSKVLNQYATDLLIREPRLFDTFAKEGKTSVAFRMVFQSFDRTLTNEEIDKVMEVIYEHVKEKGWEVR